MRPPEPSLAGFDPRDLRRGYGRSVVWKNFKLEGNTFTGREPDENRYDFERPRFDSASVRLSWNPTSDLWALQVSHGYIKSPEELHPKTKIHRTTALGDLQPPARPRHQLVESLSGARTTPLRKAKRNRS